MNNTCENIPRSFGGFESDSSQSIAAWGINVGSKFAQGVSKMCSNFFSGSSAAPIPSSSAPSSYGPVGRGRSGSNASQVIWTSLMTIKFATHCFL